MPSLIVPRGERFGARIPSRRGERWLGTFDTREMAEAAIERERSGATRRGRTCSKRHVRPPSLEHVLALAAAAPTQAFRAFMLTAAFSGLRLSEVAKLDGEDVDAEQGVLRVRRGAKNGEPRTSLLFEPGLSELARFAPASGPIWQTKQGRRWSRQYVSKAWIPMRDEVGFPGTFHTLRHFHACWLIDRGASDLDVSIQLGHQDNGEEVRRRYGRYRSEQAARHRLEQLR